jgi:transposase
VDEITRIFVDTSKSVFQLHGVNSSEQVVVRKKLSRGAFVAFFAKLAPTVVAMEACGSAHHWARTLSQMGHEVKLIAPQLIKPYIKRNKNDARDAEGGCEAMSRPTMRFVPVKSTERQAALMITVVRDRLVRAQTQLSNAIRGHASEFGLVAAKGLGKIEPLLARVAADESLPALARRLFAELADEYAQLQARLASLARTRRRVA